MPKEFKLELEANQHSLTTYCVLGVGSTQVPLYRAGKLSGLAFIYANTYTAVSAVEEGRCLRVGQEKLHRGGLH